MVLGALDACLPIPNRSWVSATIQGVLHRGGRPLSGIQLRLAKNSDYCTEPEAVTRTDAAGHFSFEAVHHWHALLILIGDPSWGYAICLPRGGEWAAIHSDGGIPEPRVQVETLDCDLAHPLTDTTAFFGARPAVERGPDRGGGSRCG